MPNEDLIPALHIAPIGDEQPILVFLCPACARKAHEDDEAVKGIPRRVVRQALNARDEWRLNCARCQERIPLIQFDRGDSALEGEDPFAELVDYEDAGFVRDGYQVFTLVPQVERFGPSMLEAKLQEGHPLKVNDTIWLIHHTVKLADSVLAYCLPPIM